MGFLSSLMKIGGLIGAPFTGGASLGLTGLGAAMGGGDDQGGGVADMLSGIGKTTSGAATGAASGRQLDTRNILDHDQLANQQYSTHQGAETNAGQLDLQRKDFTEKARGGRAQQAMLASILGGGFTPTSINVPGVKSATLSGGLMDSMKAPGAQQAMQELMRQALAAQMEGGKPGGETFTGGSVLTPPPLSALPKAGKLENVMGGIGLGGSILSTILANIKKQSGGG